MKAGIFSIGLDTYWPQFDGLLDNLKGYHSAVFASPRQVAMELRWVSGPTAS